MSRTLSGAMASHIAGRVHRRVMMMRLDLADGTSLGFTAHDRDIDFDLGAGLGGGGNLTYRPRTGITPSDIAWSAGFDPDDVEIEGPLGEDVTRAALLGGRFDDAVARLFFVDWGNLSAGAIPLLRGRVVLAEAVGQRFKLTINGDIARFSQRRGVVIAGHCRAEFGDVQCGVTPETLAATVTAVVSRRQVAISYTGSFADDYWNLGTAEFTSGPLVGTRPIEIFKFDQSSAGVAGLTLWHEAVELPEVGDTLTLTQGCEKTRAACMGFANIENFRGFPDVPGSDQVLRYPNPA